ncbi:PilC/PilY family type IV pilus protein [Stenotrophomonas sp. NLF4-10]|uniref:pilus assembly protein n=1 Tax=Stenotrophomonas sp. NLF4-10 TaxID=2918754 RepID=UPI001EFAD103|nr:PilC/PilY family type IV pilus protein [Stenotrophomonas sp. NLF4-10]MCG8276167.1 pilus assembly protein [Stenotrophomonas sp. NLF4-10]
MRMPPFPNSLPVPHRHVSPRVLPMLVAFGITLMVSPANAGITLPTDPLTTGARVPPNILFIIDDSGSMAFEGMPSRDITKSVDNASSWDRQTYVNNTVYYDPRRTYTAWVNPDGTLMTGGTSYNAVYGDFNLASGKTIDLAKDNSCRSYNRNNNATSADMDKGTEVCGGTQTFYVPISTATTLVTDRSEVYRYQIHTDGRVVRSRYGTRVRGEANRDCGTKSSDWGSCEYVTPTGRSEADERTNYATWFSYHRTRMKSAKAGAGLAFSQLGSNVRVGFRTIWGRNGAETNGNWPNQAVPIPVGNNQGLFDNPNGLGGDNNNRTRWYQRLYGTIGYNGTPLHKALDDAGKYFSSNATTGPYGPGVVSDQLSCRQNFTILTTDGYWNNLDIDVGEQDNSSGATITGTDGTSYSYEPSAPYASGNSNTLADVAMRYWKNDLRTDLDNNVRAGEKDPAFWQHMVTFGISLGLAGTTGYGSVAEVPANFSGWPNPMDAEDGDRIDDLLHAAVNSRGNFVSAADPEAFVNGLTTALADITGRTGSFSNVSNNSATLNAGSRVFQAKYVPGVWEGEVAAYPLTSDGVGTTPSWEASGKIPATNRKVFTSTGAFPADATAGQLAALTRTGIINYPVTGADNAAYLAGARTLEAANGGTLRNRKHLLGDVVGSSPAHVADTNTLYVGANDGMLHAINADTGVELFGFIPNGISWADLGSLSRPDYTHRYFVDGPIVVSTRTQTPSKNLLVAGLGKGGKGLFVLDVTNPASFNQSQFKWEVTGSDADMGLVQSRPIIAKLNNGVTALIVSNGVNSSNGHAVLLAYNLETGNLIKKIDTGSGSSVLDHADSNGLSAPTGWDADGNGTLDYVYAGDMLGNVWKFDLSGGLAAGWGLANSGNPIFSASYVKADGTVVRQPITGALTLAMHPTTYRTWLFFGTGRLLTTGDMENMDVQSMYGFVDDGTTLVRNGVNANLTKRNTIVAGTRNGMPVRSFQDNENLPASSKGWYLDLLTPPANLPEGERIVTDAQLLSDGRQTALITASAIPTASACQSDGRGYINALDAFTGTSLFTSFFDVNKDGGFKDDVLTSGGKDVPIGSVDTGVGMPTMPDLVGGGEPEDPCLVTVTGSNGEVRTLKCNDIRNLGRVSWREIKRGG